MTSCVLGERPICTAGTVLARLQDESQVLLCGVGCGNIPEGWYEAAAPSPIARAYRLRITSRAIARIAGTGSEGSGWPRAQPVDGGGAVR